MPVGAGFLSAFLAKLRTDVYSKRGTSGTAVATLTEQTIPEMQETIHAGDGDKIMVSSNCLLDLGPGNDLLPGELPSEVSGFEGGGTPPSDLDKITDGDDSTSTTTAIADYGYPGNIFYDLGEKLVCTARVKAGIWKSGTHPVNLSLRSSEDGEDWSEIASASLSVYDETIVYLNGVGGKHRYYWLKISKSNTGTGYCKIYEFNLWKGDADEPPYLSIWPEANGVEMLPKGKEYEYLITPASFLIMRAYEIPADGDYLIEVKMQELPRSVGHNPYESYYQIPENERFIIIQHTKGIGGS